MSLGNVPYDPSLLPSTLEWMERVRQEISRPRRPIFISARDFNGSPTMTEINSLKIYGARASAVADNFYHLFNVPKDFNVGTNIKVEVVWTTSSSTLSQTATWRVRYSATAVNETLGAATTALDSLIVADNVVGAYSLAISPFGLIFPGKWSHGDFVSLEVTLSSVSGLNPASDLIYLIGILLNDEG